MSDDEPLSQVDLEQLMMDAVQKGEHAMREIRVRGEARAEAKRAFKVAFAQALLKSPADTVGEREAEATIATGEELFAFELADSMLTAAVEAARSLREQQATLRSVNANLRPAVTG